jgi:hypothetical protein
MAMTFQVYDRQLVTHLKDHKFSQSGKLNKNHLTMHHNPRVGRSKFIQFLAAEIEGKN